MGPSRSGLSKLFVTTVGRVCGSAARKEKTVLTVKKTSTAQGKQFNMKRLISLDMRRVGFLYLMLE